MDNSDYNFVALLPSGLTAWSGVADVAPFHGFTIFLDSTKKSCIDFEVHIRVDESTEPKRPQGAKRVSLGKAIGWESMSTGLIDGTRFENITITFSFVQPDQVDDGDIILVTPKSQAEASMKIYNEFIHHLAFGLGRSGVRQGRP